MNLKQLIKKWFGNEETKPVTPPPPPIVIDPVVVKLPSAQPKFPEDKVCSIDLSKPDFECLAGMMRLDPGRDREHEANWKLWKKGEDRYFKVARKIFELSDPIPANTAPDEYFRRKNELTLLIASLIFVLHYRECSCSFNKVLHNGELLSEVNKRGTILVPKGRGKGRNWTWEDAAVDAMLIKENVWPKGWLFGEVLAFAERFNGLGYRSRIGDKGKIELTPYVFAGTNLHDETGKYIKDGKYSATAKEAQLGVGAMMLDILNRHLGEHKMIAYQNVSLRLIAA